MSYPFIIFILDVLIYILYEVMIMKPGLVEFHRTFSGELRCSKFLFKQRWPDGFKYPECQGKHYSFLYKKPETLSILKLPLPGFDNSRYHFSQNQKTSSFVVFNN